MLQLPVRPGPVDWLHGIAAEQTAFRSLFNDMESLYNELCQPSADEAVMHDPVDAGSPVEASERERLRAFLGPC